MTDNVSLAKESLAEERRDTAYSEYNLEHFGTRGSGFDLSNINETSNAEIETSLQQYLQHVRDRGQFYGLNALTFLTDNRPDISKLAAMGGGGIPKASSVTRRGRCCRTSA